ncbi:hypothetical protein CXG81DRAFT_5908, partial [Caulochytrium protostelioides]
LAATLMVRVLVGLGGYAGEHRPPIYSDFEAQRHWMELTTHLPLRAWYRYRSDWWPLDYPPLSGFHAYILGRIGHAIHPAWMALRQSEGFESPGLRFFMRSTAIVTECTLLIPAMWAWTGCRFLSASPSPSPSRDRTQRLTAFAYLAAFPLLTLVDHGHFQYNAAMFGFALWALVFWHRGAYVRGAIAFVCALSFKQIALYYAIPVFCHLLTECSAIARRGAPWRALLTLASLGAAVIATFGLAVMPFVAAATIVGTILRRVFPVSRGLLEGLTANLWCVVDVVMKLQRDYTTDQLLRLSTAVTAAAVVPWNAVYLTVPAAKYTSFLYLLAISALGFFLCSYLVHEKGIMLTALPLLMLMPVEPTAAAWFQLVAMWTNYFMLRDDGQALPYAALGLGWMAVAAPMMPWRHPHALVRRLGMASIGTMVALHVAQLTIPPPQRYVLLYPLLFAGVGALQFALFYLY